MKVLSNNRRSCEYLLQGLGGKGQEFGLGFGDQKLCIGFSPKPGEIRSCTTSPSKVLGAILDRSKYLRRIIDCVETGDAIASFEEILSIWGWDKNDAIPWEIPDAGHKYHLPCFDGSTQTLTFIKRGGGAITYKEEWPGVQTQEVQRMLIHFFDSNHDGSTRVQESIELLQQSLFAYEARAHRRKMESVNRKAPVHDDSARPRAWRDQPFDDVPFSWENIKGYPVGDDGHIIVT